MYNYHPSCRDLCLWANFDFGMLLKLSATMCTCHLGHYSPGIGHFWPNLRVDFAVNGVFGCACTIPIWSSVDLSYEPILTVECFCSNLQPCVHLIWVKSALELLVFGQHWGSAWQKMLWLTWNYMYNSHFRLYNQCLWTHLDFGMLLQPSTIMHTCNLGQSSPQNIHFWPNLRVGLALCGVFRWKVMYESHPL